jgi:hypothetical protein
MKKKIIDFILSLEDEIIIKGVKFPKKYIFIGILALIIYFAILLINLNFSKTPIFGEKRNPEYKNIILKNQEKDFEKMKSFVEEPEEKENSYEENIQKFLNISNEEIKKIFREQNLNISDAEIDNFRKNFLTSMPKNQVQIEKKIEKLKNLDIDTSKIIHEKAKEINR